MFCFKGKTDLIEKFWLFLSGRILSKLRHLYSFALCHLQDIVLRRKNYKEDSHFCQDKYSIKIYQKIDIRILFIKTLQTKMLQEIE